MKTTTNVMKMNWETCYAGKSELEKVQDKTERSRYQRDYDRIIFSSAFRRLQNKTQVFPLPGTAFVHNRLTHSLEVASVGRSLGTLVGRALAKDMDPDSNAYQFYFYELSNVVGAACLAHDVGNPAFGHSGEDAISNYFRTFSDTAIEGTVLRAFYNDQEWEDITSFEGNANALRILTQSFNGKSNKGKELTNATLAAILKYPCESIARNKKQKHTKKYGFFQSEKTIFMNLVDELQLVPESDQPIAYKRHPFVYLVEAADDICYNIIDMEDAHRIGILSKERVSSAFMELISGIGLETDDMEKIHETYHSIGDANESIAYLRSKCINTLTTASANVFLENKDKILAAEFNSSLISELEQKTTAINKIEQISLEEIYRHQQVLEIEIAGFNVMSGLLKMYVPAVLREFKNPIDNTLIRLIPNQFKPKADQSAYLKTMCVLDHISSMTDAYAVEHYRKLTGIEV